MDKSTAFTKDNEGYRQYAYQCTAGKNTIGIGFNLDDVGLSEAESMVILDMRLTKAERDLAAALPWFNDLNDARKGALKDMAYQMGVVGLFKFRKSLALMRDEEYELASREFLDSKWAKQTPKRAKKVSYMIATGCWMWA